MGKELGKLYKEIKSKYGEIGLYRLIVKTRISEDLASELEDSDNNILKIRSAISNLGLEVTIAEKTKSRRNLIGRLFRRKK